MKAMLDVDEHHWWYRGRRRIIRAELDRLAACRPAQSCSTRAAGPAGRSRSSSTTARSAASSSTRKPRRSPAAAASDVEIGRLEELPWDDATFDLITCLDVIEHTPDDRATLRELRRVCKPGGWLLVTVPAYQALWSLHDEANHHYRRYSRSSLRFAAVEARDGSWSGSRRSTWSCSLPRLRSASPSAGAATTGPTRRSSGSVRTGSTRPSSARSGWRPRWLARGGTLPAGLSLLAVMQEAPPRTGSLMFALAALISVSSKLGYLLPAIIGLESMGVPSPGETALVAAAVLASQGKLEIWLVILIGDHLGDRRRQHRVRPRPAGLDGRCSRRRGPYFTRRLLIIRYGDRFFEKHGGKAVFLARWVALVRIAAAWLAGINRMPIRYFFFWNALGAITWGITYGLVGYFLGKSAARILSEVGIAGAILLVAMLIAGYVLLRRRERQLLERDE